MGFSRQGYWSGLPLPSPEDPPNPGIEPVSLALQADALPSELKGRSNGNQWQHFFSFFMKLPQTFNFSAHHRKGIYAAVKQKATPENTYESRWQSATPDTAHMERRLCRRWSPRTALYYCTTYTPYRCSCSWDMTSLKSRAFCTASRFDLD